MQHFTRRETVILTRTSPSRLAYLARTGIVVPYRYTTRARVHQVYYSWEQILELRAIRQLRRQVSLQMIRKVLTFLEDIGSDRTLRNKNLVITNGAVAWVQTPQGTTPKIVQVATKTDQHVGQLQLMPLPSLGAAAGPFRSIPEHAKVIDLEKFRQRIPTLS